MTEPAHLDVRHVRLIESVTIDDAPLADGEPGVFIALDEPPPVRTVLEVVQGDQRRPLEVVRVVEVAERDERNARGMYGRWVDEAALAKAHEVGTEHMEDGTPVVQPVYSDNSAGIRISDAPAGMAMPAPVMVVDDDTGVVDVYEQGVPEQTSRPAEDYEATDEGPGAEATHQASETEASDAAAPSEDADADSEAAYGEGAQPDDGAPDDGDAASAEDGAQQDGSTGTRRKKRRNRKRK